MPTALRPKAVSQARSQHGDPYELGLSVLLLLGVLYAGLARPSAPEMCAKGWMSSLPVITEIIHPMTAFLLDTREQSSQGRQQG